MNEAQHEKQKEIYKENCEHFRSLNSIMWKIPTLCMMINSGLWFAVSQFKPEDFISCAILTFASFCNYKFEKILHRVRHVMDTILKRTLEYEGSNKIIDKNIVVENMSEILTLASIANILYALYFAIKVLK